MSSKCQNFFCFGLLVVSCILFFALSSLLLPARWIHFVRFLFIFIWILFYFTGVDTIAGLSFSLFTLDADPLLYRDPSLHHQYGAWFMPISRLLLQFRCIYIQRNFFHSLSISLFCSLSLSPSISCSSILHFLTRSWLYRNPSSCSTITSTYFAFNAITY